MIECSRWSELSDTMRFLANMTKSAKSHTEFRLLNGSPPIVLGIGDENEESRCSQLMYSLGQPPSGGTPLCAHIAEVTNQIKQIQDKLRLHRQKAVLVIFTDGEPSDGDISLALEPLKTLPVMIVLRFCTDDSRIVSYWDSIDKQLELDMDVLDDLTGEAREVVTYNTWLTYGDTLHRIREFGCISRELDMIDEAPLSLEQMRAVCSML